MGVEKLGLGFCEMVEKATGARPGLVGERRRVAADVI